MMSKSDLGAFHIVMRCGCYIEKYVYSGTQSDLDDDV